RQSLGLFPALAVHRRRAVPPRAEVRLPVRDAVGSAVSRGGGLLFLSGVPVRAEVSAGLQRDAGDRTADPALGVDQLCGDTAAVVRLELSVAARDAVPRTAEHL